MWIVSDQQWPGFPGSAVWLWFNYLDAVESILAPLMTMVGQVLQEGHAWEVGWRLAFEALLGWEQGLCLFYSPLYLQWDNTVLNDVCWMNKHMHEAQWNLLAGPLGFWILRELG